MDTLRISDADRATALDLLSEQYAVGRPFPHKEPRAPFAEQRVDGRFPAAAPGGLEDPQHPVRDGMRLTTQVGNGQWERSRE